MEFNYQENAFGNMFLRLPDIHNVNVQGHNFQRRENDDRRRRREKTVRYRHEFFHRDHPELRWKVERRPSTLFNAINRNLLLLEFGTKKHASDVRQLSALGKAILNNLRKDQIIQQEKDIVIRLVIPKSALSIDALNELSAL